jgi:hypothetical protein
VSSLQQIDRPTVRVYHDALTRFNQRGALLCIHNGGQTILLTEDYVERALFLMAICHLGIARQALTKPQFNTTKGILLDKILYDVLDIFSDLGLLNDM